MELSLLVEELGMTAPMIIDADSHVTESPDVWTSRMSSKKWGELVPRIRRDETSGMEYWFVGDRRMGAVGTSSWAIRDGRGGRARWDRAYPELPASFDVLHPSAYDAKERLKVLDEFGIRAACLYPNLNFVAADMYAGAGDEQHAFQRECIRAYNDWLIEWASADPDRLLPLGLVPYFDPEAAAAEVVRCREIGHRGLVMTGAPQQHDRPFLADRHWDPLWSAAQETAMPISFHIGGGDISEHFNEDRQAVEGAAAMTARGGTAMFLDNAARVNDLLLSGILPRFPDLKFVAVETGMGWVPFILESADYNFKNSGVARERPEFEALPSEYFKRQVYVTYWYEKLEPFHVERIGAENLLFETDYPHNTSLEVDEVQWAIEEGLREISQDVRDRVLWRNAAELYGLDVTA